MRLLEGAEAARATATGMAAVTSALLCFLKAGDHIVAARALFGSCRYVVEDLCPRFGIASTLVDGRDTTPGKRPCGPTPRRSSSRRRPIRPSTWSTSPRCPRSPTPPAPWWWSTTCSPRRMLQKPLKLGADIVVYSATKHIDGQGRCLGGVVLGSQAYVKDHLHNFLKHTGPSLSPFNAWVMLKGLETLPMRVRAQCESGRQDRRPSGGPGRASSACCSAAGPTTRRRRSPSGR